MPQISSNNFAATAVIERPLADRVRPDGLLVRAGRASGGAADRLLPDVRTWNALFGAPALSSEECDALASVARPRLVEQGSEIFSHNERPRALLLVRDGDVALGFRTPDGLFRTERTVRGPAWIDQGSAWLGEAHAIDARAMTPAVIIELQRDALQVQLDEHPALARRLIVSLAREVQALAVNTHELMHKDAPARLAAWLLQRCQPLGDARSRAVVHLTERKRDIASQLAITPETLSRLMRSFSRQGVINVAGYTVSVLDVDGLERLAAE